MHKLLEQIHMYVGLLVWSALMVYGIAGLTGTVRASRKDRAEPSVTPEVLPFVVPPNATDKQVADLAWKALQIPFTEPEPEWAMQHDSENNLTFGLYSPNGVTRVTVLEKTGQLRVERLRNSVWQYFDDLHSMTANYRRPDWRLRLWAYYNEVALWMLMAMALTGLLLWLTSRPGLGLARAAFLLATGAFVVLYFLTR